MSDRESPRVLRCPVQLRGHLVWILAVLLLVGAASYSHGSRYTIVGHGYSQSAAAESAAPGATGQAVGQAAGPSAGPSSDPEYMEDNCCERRQAPRSEPAPLRTGAVDPPSLLHGQPGPAILAGNLPPEPDLPALTVVQLSISRT